MKFTIDESSCKKVNLSIPEVMVIILLRAGIDINTLIAEMKEKQIIVESTSLMGSTLLVTQRWNDLCDKALLTADTTIPREDRIVALAKSLMEIFPEGKKEGTSQYWRGNIRDITLRLQKFFKLYGNKYTDEQIILAAQNYVSSHNGNYSYMRVLKYFICKNEKKMDIEGHGYIEEVSDLATFIENANSQKERGDWTTTII